VSFWKDLDIEIQGTWTGAAGVMENWRFSVVDIDRPLFPWCFLTDVQIDCLPASGPIIQVIA
jgi:hypothetical protein